jgi:hypothetical protein
VTDQFTTPTMSPVGLLHLLAVSLVASLVSGERRVDTESRTQDSSYDQQQVLEQLSRQKQEILAAKKSRRTQQQAYQPAGPSREQLAALLTGKCLNFM